MQLQVTYIHHNCFVIQAHDRTFLLDYPDEGLLPPGARERALDLIRGTNLYVFITHSHDDHFTPKVRSLAETAASVHYILSYDVVDFHPEFEALPRVAVAEPDEPFQVEDMDILPLESTDLGVGFLVHWQGKRLWFGGDVALWAWPNADQASKDFSLSHYQDSLGILSQHPIDMALVNADPRLPDWAGAELFIGEVHPNHFIPMHSFGQLDELERFVQEASQNTPEGVIIHGYAESGQKISITI